MLRNVSFTDLFVFNIFIYSSLIVFYFDVYIY